MRINPAGNSGLYFRANPTGTWPEGYEAQINRSYPLDRVRTGSLYKLAPTEAGLITFDDTWFDIDVVCRDEADGVRVQIRINGMLVTDHLDTEREHATGHIALQQHHGGSEVQFTELWVRELAR